METCNGEEQRSSAAAIPGGWPFLAKKSYFFCSARVRRSLSGGGSVWRCAGSRSDGARRRVPPRLQRPPARLRRQDDPAREVREGDFSVRGLVKRTVQEPQRARGRR